MDINKMSGQIEFGDTVMVETAQERCLAGKLISFDEDMVWIEYPAKDGHAPESETVPISWVDHITLIRKGPEPVGRNGRVRPF